MRTRLPRALVIALALVIGVGGAVALAAPASADTATFTAEVDTSQPIYPGSTLSWGGSFDASGTLSTSWKVHAVGSLGTGTTIEASCDPLDGESEPVDYTCSWTPTTQSFGPGQWELTGTVSYGSGTTSSNEPAAFTIADPAPVVTSNSPVRQGSLLQFGGNKLAGGRITGFTVDPGWSPQSITPDCTGTDEGSTAWSCSWAANLSLGDYTLQVEFADANGVTSSSQAGFTVTEPASVGYSFGPGTVTVSGIPLDDIDQANLMLTTWDPSAWEHESDPFPPAAECVLAPFGESAVPRIDAVVDGDLASCTFAVDPGVYTVKLSIVDGPAVLDSYVVIPAAPQVSAATGSPDGSGSIAGSGTPGDTIRVVTGTTPLCTTTVTTGGTWTCAITGLATGSYPLTVWEENVENPISCAENACPSNNDPQIFYRSGGRSTDVTAQLTITSPPPPTTPSRTTSTPVWVLTITGLDLTNVHPGDHFTATGTGLPPGSTVTFVLHSTPVTLGSATVARDGSYTFAGVIPSDVAPGAHQIIATLSGAGLTTTSNTQAVTVTSASAAETQVTTQAETPTTREKHDVKEQIEPEVEPNVLTEGLHSIGDVVAHPQKVPAAVAIGLVLLILGVVPAHLLDATVSEQYERLGRRFPALSRRPRWFERLQGWLRRAPGLGGLAVTTATAVLFCFADPRFGFTLASLRMLIALAVALFVVTYVVDAITSLIMRRAWGVAVTVSLRPLGLLLSLAGVIVSRLLDFSPGFLIGLVLGLSISGTAAGRYAWRAVLLRSGLVIAFAIAAWVGYSAFSHKGAESDWVSALLLELLVAIATEGIVALLVELLPLHLLEGERLFHRSKVLWGALYVLTVTVFVVAVVPWEGNWAQLGSGLWTWLAILGGFAVIATGVYLFFRIRSREEHEVEDDVESPASISIGED